MLRHLNRSTRLMSARVQPGDAGMPNNTRFRVRIRLRVRVVYQSTKTRVRFIFIDDEGSEVGRKDGKCDREKRVRRVLI